MSNVIGQVYKQHLIIGVSTITLHLGVLQPGSWEQHSWPFPIKSPFTLTHEEGVHGEQHVRRQHSPPLLLSLQPMYLDFSLWLKMTLQVRSRRHHGRNVKALAHKATVKHRWVTEILTGMVGIKKLDEMVSIVLGKKQVENSITICDIPAVVCNNQGNQKLPVKMNNVVLTPGCAFNLFSISKRLKQGCTLWGNADALVLISHNGKHQVKFDIQISTSNGTLFAIYMK